MSQTTIPENARADENFDLPESPDIHWSASRKGRAVRAVRDRLLTFDKARWRYLPSHREFGQSQRSRPPDGGTAEIDR